MGIKSNIGETLFDRLFLKREKDLCYYMDNMMDKTGPLYRYWDSHGDLTGDACDDMALLLDKVMSNTLEEL